MPPMDASRRASGALVRELVIGLTAFLTVVDLFATQAILPSLVRHYQVTPGRHGLRRQRQHHGHGGLRPRRGAVLPAHRPPARHPGQPRAARHTDGAAGGRARARHLHAAAHRAGRLHGLGIHADARLSRRGIQRRRRGRRLRRLHHRQRREQPDRPADLGGASPIIWVWPRTSTSSQLSTWPARCWSTSRCTRPRRCRRWGRRSPRRSRPGRSICATRRCAPASASASASCSPSSAPSPSSTSC